MVAEGILKATDAKQDQFQIADLATSIGTYPNVVVRRDDLHAVAIAGKQIANLPT